jgi:hypothetical protein
MPIWFGDGTRVQLPPFLHQMNKPPVAVAFSFGRGNEHETRVHAGRSRDSSNVHCGRSTRRGGRAMQRAPRATTPASCTMQQGTAGFETRMRTVRPRELTSIQSPIPLKCRGFHACRRKRKPRFPSIDPGQRATSGFQLEIPALRAHPGYLPQRPAACLKAIQPAKES